MLFYILGVLLAFVAGTVVEHYYGPYFKAYYAVVDFFAGLKKDK